MKLRELLGVPVSLSILPSKSSLPDVSPLRVFVTTDQDVGVYRTFVKRIDEWTRKNGTKYGNVEVVSKLDEADAILVWYSVKMDEVIKPSSNMLYCCPVRDYSYLILRQPEKLEVLRRIIIEGYADPTASGHSGDTLRAEFFKRLKVRRKK